MPDMGILRGLITLLTCVTFIGICWWAYRPENRVRFEEDGWLAFGDEEPRRPGESGPEEATQSGEEPQPVSAVADDNESDRATLRKVEGSQA
jgi:cytochrome c oxidase cbb3-type subunit 4